MNATRIARVLLAAFALVIVIVRIGWNQPLSQDELEYFRTARWISEGQVPYRDFWEHHLPLHWFVFAPVAAVVGDGAGVATIIAMRWAQLPLWFATFSILFVLMRRFGISAAQAAIALVLLPASLSFVIPAVHFRVDTLGSLAYVGALAVALLHPRSRNAWIAFGALMSVAVLVNMRLAPLVVVTAALLLFIRIDERRWRFNAIALWMSAGVAALVALFLGYLVATGSVEAFRDAMNFNLATDRIAGELIETFNYRLFEPFRERDAGGIALWLGGIAGGVLALRRIRQPDLFVIATLLALVSVFLISRLGVHYTYHFQTTFLLCTPLIASLMTKDVLQKVGMAVVALALVINFQRLRAFTPRLGAELRYQDAIMRTVHARTQPNERVFDAVGFAIHRPPAYRYWFLPAGVRFLAVGRAIEPYGAREMLADPPAAIVFGRRTMRWMQAFPDSALYAMRHYIPLYRDLWVPGMNARIEPRRPRFSWVVPRDGTYRLYASPLLARHPWFREPVTRAVAGDGAEQFVIPLRQLPSADLRLARVTVDGKPVTANVITLRKGQFLELQGSWPEPVGVLFAPHDVTELLIAPEISFLM